MPRFSTSHPIPEDMNNIIKATSLGLGTVGVPAGLIGPGTDLPVIGASWVGMTIALAEKAGHKLDRQKTKKICLAVATGAGAFLAGSKVAATAVGWIGAFFTAGISLAVAAASNAALNATFTRAYGRACARYFLQAEEIATADVVVAVLMALIGAEMGLDLGGSEYLA